MNVNQGFIDDFNYLRDFYGWNPKDIEEMKMAIRQTEEDGKRYIRALADAHRAGYKQDASNGFIRLQAWCADRGMPDPFAAAK